MLFFLVESVELPFETLAVVSLAAKYSLVPESKWMLSPWTPSAEHVLAHASCLTELFESYLCFKL